MIYKTLKNVTKDTPIIDYPIAEADFNSQGELVLDENKNYKTTGQTLKWTIVAGETLRFPSYVADILLERYGVEDKDSGRCILKEVEDVAEKVEEIPQVTGETKNFNCKKCGKSFVSSKGLALHWASAHPELLK